MDGWNSSMSKQMKLNCCLFSIDLNQLITAVVFFHWLRLCFFAILVLMRSRMFLLILPISDLGPDYMSRAGPVSRAVSVCRDNFQPGIT